MKLKFNMTSIVKRAGLGLSVFALALFEQIKMTGHLPRTWGEWGLDFAGAGLSMIPAGADKTGVGAAVKAALQGAQTVLSAPANARKSAAQAQETALLAKLAPVAEAAAIKAISERTGQFSAGTLFQAAPAEEPMGTAQAAPATVAPLTPDAHDDHLIATLENEGGPILEPTPAPPAPLIFPVVTHNPDGSIEVAS